MDNTATHNSPRTWFLTSSLSPLSIRLIRLLLAHGDYVVACLPPQEIANDDRSAEFRELINECKSSRKDREGWKDRIRGIRCDGRVMGQCSAAVAEAVQVFGRIDILLCCKTEGKSRRSLRPLRHGYSCSAWQLSSVLWRSSPPTPPPETW
jgi:NAD(P)-dependent dehydrogenase (short-subunit alcohol dehydrogenase family)